MTKPGYGIISECVANGTAILYTSRGRFAEYERPGAGDAALPPLRIHRSAGSVRRTLGCPRLTSPVSARASRAPADGRGRRDCGDDRESAVADKDSTRCSGIIGPVSRPAPNTLSRRALLRAAVTIPPLWKSRTSPRHGRTTSASSRCSIGSRSSGIARRISSADGRSIASRS